MPSLGDLGINFEANTMGATRDIRNLERTVQRSTGNMADSTERVGTANTSVSTSTIAMGNIYAMLGEKALQILEAMIRKTIELAKETTMMAVEFESSFSNLNFILNKSAGALEKWGKRNAQNLGISRLELVKYASTYSNLFKNMTDDTKVNAKITQEMLEKSAYVSSRTGRTMEDVMDRIRSGLLGETDAIEDLGINVNIAMIEATKAFKRFAVDKSWSQLDFKAQSAIRTFAILEQATKSTGDTIAETTAMELQRLNAIIQDTKLAFGEALLPVLQATLPIFISMAKVIERIAVRISAFSKGFFDATEVQKKASKTSDDLGKAQLKLGNDIKKAGDTSRGGLKSFDELNVMQKDLTKETAKSSDDIRKYLEELYGTDFGGVNTPEEDLEFWEKFGEKLKEFTYQGSILGSATEFKKRIEQLRKTIGEEKIEAFELGVPINVVYKILKSQENLGAKIKTKLDEFVLTSIPIITLPLSFAYKTSEDEGLQERINNMFSNISFENLKEKFNTNFKQLRTDTNNWFWSIKERIRKTIEEDIPDKLKWENIKNKAEGIWISIRKNTNDWFWSIKERIRKTIEEDIPKLNWEEISNKAEETWNKVKNSTKIIWDSIAYAIKSTLTSAINFVIGKVNTLIEAISKIKFEVEPLKVFGKTLFPGATLKFPKIDTLDLLEEPLKPSQQPTITPPPNLPSRVATSERFDNEGLITGITNAIIQAIELFNTGTNTQARDIVLNVDGEELARTTYDPFKEEQRRRGQTIIVTG